MKGTPKPKIIPEDVVEASWQEVAALSDNKALREMNRLSSAQPALLAFVMARAEGLGKNGQEIGVYMFMVIFRMFESHFGRLAKVDVKTVQGLAVKNEEEDDAGEEAQPFVMRYVTDCLSDDDDDIDLSEEDQETLLLTMKIIVDAFDANSVTGV